MITFTDLEKKYLQAVECMAYNEQAALDEESNPSHATWIHHPTLVRWFYGSSKEWVKDYAELSGKFQNPTQEQRKQMSTWRIAFTQRLEQFRIKVGKK